MTSRKALIGTVLLLLLMAATDEAGGRRYTAGGDPVMPADYRAWLFLSAGLEANYSQTLRGHWMLNSWFADRAAWQGFEVAGRWPDRSTLVMEIRGALAKASINLRLTVTHPIAKHRHHPVVLVAAWLSCSSARHASA